MTDEVIAQIKSGFQEAEDAEGVSSVQRLAGLAAEAMLVAGDLSRAAVICRAAGMTEAAQRLYTEILGAPEEGARGALADGDHEAAAELFEVAGRGREAAAALSAAARRAARPSRYVERIFRLDRDEGLRFLDDLLCARVPDVHNAPLYYRLGVELAGEGRDDRARRVFASLRETIGTYADVDARLAALGSSPPPPGPRADPSTTPTADLAPTPGEVSAQEAVLMVREAVRVAARRVRTSLLPARVTVVEAEGAPRSLRTRVARTPVPPLLDDTLVREARTGPKIATLSTFVRGEPCTLRNIEVFYRIGIAHLAAGNWDEARVALDAVEEASPGYRDASARAEAIRGWQEGAGVRVAARFDAEVHGRYRLCGELGRGGMAVVYRAEDRLLARDVALKFTHVEQAWSPSLEAATLAEARAAARLNHPNVVTIFDFGTSLGRPFIAMELVEGIDLGRQLERDGTLPVLEVVRCMVGAMEGVEYAHNRGVLHRDIKPSNLLRTPAGGVKVSDFGIAGELSAAGFERLLGTAAYMAPEQFQRVPVDRRADVFALGVSFFELLTNELPFEGARRDRPAARVGSLRAGVPRLVEEAIHNALQLDPGRRYHTVGEFLAPLRQVLDSVADVSGGLLRDGGAAFEVVPSLPPIS